MGEITDLIFTLIGKAGRWYNIKGQRICFVLWSIVMIYWIYRNYELGLKVQTCGCMFSLGMHIYGWYNWTKEKIGMKKQD